jgi:epoxyqueuosine reductase QueG
MTKYELIDKAEKYTVESPDNYVSGESAIAPEYTGMKFFESPIFAFGRADDELFDSLKSPDTIGKHFLTPREWLPDAKTVISFFLPYTDRIKTANRQNHDWPADEWLHGRYEGQLYINKLTGYLMDLLSNNGYQSMAPAFDPRYEINDPDIRYTSKWAERHIAFVCGLGTFGLSKGIITEKGMCGRLGSVITALDLPKNERPYKDIYEYCAMCGACIPNCPAGAISLAEGKKHPPCSDFLDKTREKCNPRYGCGKCQVNVPCESGIPTA